MIYCPECKKVMEHQLTRTDQGGHEYKLYTCTPCRVRCAVETQFYYDADYTANPQGEQK